MQLDMEETYLKYVQYILGENRCGWNKLILDASNNISWIFTVYFSAQETDRIIEPQLTEDTPPHNWPLYVPETDNNCPASELPLSV